MRAPDRGGPAKGGGVPAPLPESDAVARFLEMMAAERGASANTLAAYRRDLDAAARCVPDLVAADGQALAGLGAAWADLAPASLARRCSALRQFYGFLVDEGLRGDDPSAALPAPRPRRPLPRVLGHAQVEALLACAEEEARSGDPRALRMLALVELLYGSGLRATELVSLPIAAVPRDAPLLAITGKGGQQRLVPVGDKARAALARWLRVRPEGPRAGGAPAGEARGRESRYVFPSGSGAGHLSRVRLFQLLRELAGRAGLSPEAVSPHVLRHAFASHLLEGGADLRVLQTLLGHADIATTQIYTHVDAARLVAIVNHRHPLAAHGGAVDLTPARS